ncbi:MAG: hypothetical protein KA137_06670 [Halioglobus sp.]|nr:hypothetical protein [Halioglobus sp.]
MITVDNLLDGSASAKESARAFIEDPLSFFQMSYTKMQSVPRDLLWQLQTEALKLRFEDHRRRIPMLTKLADRQGITAINEIDDVLPLLFEHTIYKSYPDFLLEKGEYGKLTRWLDRLTPYDLSKVDCSGCKSIHSWMDMITRVTELDPITSSGTTGTMSFTPKDRKDWRNYILGGFRVQLLQKFGEPPSEADLNEKIHVCWPTHADGHTAFYRSPIYYKEYFAKGSDAHFHPMMNTPGDTDLMYLAARLRAAQARGDSRVNVPPSLLARRGELEADERERPARVKAWVDELAQNLKGERVFILAPAQLIYDVAKPALAEGIKCNFASNSSVTAGTGGKGFNMPGDWEQVVDDFLNFGRKNYGYFYSFSEQCGMHVQCEHGRLHLTPWSIPLVLDAQTSELLPREGRQKGRAAFFDVSMNGAWGGLITGDSVEIDWSECPCGRTTAHLSDNITRFGVEQGGSDKISCTATPEAHDDAMDFLTSF